MGRANWTLIWGCLGAESVGLVASLSSLKVIRSVSVNGIA